MIRDVLKYPHPLLKQASKPVTEVTPKLRELAQDMLETMYANEGIGLAAPQVGELVRMVVVDVTGPDARSAPMVLVNPELELIGEEVESEEGCLSVEEYRNTLIRSSAVRLKARDLDGKELSLETEGTLAICLQHEGDHLDGKLFIDHLSRLKRKLYDAKVKKWMKKGS